MLSMRPLSTTDLATLNVEYGTRAGRSAAEGEVSRVVVRKSNEFQSVSAVERVGLATSMRA